MLRFVIVLFLLPIRSEAAPCPDYYRFVEFGQPDRSGALQTGGPIFRVELDGRHLIDQAKTQCLDIGPVRRDGHAQPIPVVSRFDYRPDLVSDTLTGLSVIRTDADVARRVDTNAQAHRRVIASGAMEITTGPDYKCASLADTMSCEVINPYHSVLSLVAYCDVTRCTTEAIALDDTLMLSASWARTTAELASIEAAGPAIAAQVAAIQQFLTPYMSR